MAKPAKDVAVESAEERQDEIFAEEKTVQDAAADQEKVEEHDGGAADVGGATEEKEVEEVEEAEGNSEEDESSDGQSESDQLAQAKEQAAEWQGKYLRLHAEWDTYRRRKTEEAAAEKARATEKLVGEIIPVIDDFERTIDYAAKNGEEGLLGGVEAICKKLLDVLARGGVEVINPAGEEYNALEAQAVATVQDESVPDETVAEVYQKGYKMGSKVLRSAMVTVTTGGPKREKPVEEQE